MLSKKKVCAAILCILMTVLMFSIAYAEGNISVEKVELDAANVVEGNNKTVSIELNTPDISSAMLEYSVGEEIYSVNHKKITENTVEFTLDCSLPGKYALNLIHIKSGDTTITLDLEADTFKVLSADKSVYSRSGGSKGTAVPQNQRSASGKRIVVLDAGHCSTHAGAARAELREETLNLKIAQAAYNELKTYPNVDVYMTRSGAGCPKPGSSMAQCLLYRAQFAKDKGADLFVSFHNNATGATSQTSATGAFVYISNYSRFNTTSKTLTNYILTELNRSLGLKNNGAWINADDGVYGTYDDGRQKDDLSVIRNNVLFGIEPVLIEHAYMNNPKDQVLLRSDAKLKQMGISDATGIAKYLGLSKAGPTWNISGISTSVSGSKVTIKPIATGSTSGFKYKYVYVKYNEASKSYDWKDWGVISDMSTSNANGYTWTAKSAGKYKIIMDVADNNGKIYNYEKEITISPMNIGYTEVTAPANAKIGDTITVKPVVSKPSGVQFKYVYSYNNWAKWGVIKDFSANASMNFKVERGGKLDIYVDARDSNGQVQTKVATINVPHVNLTFNGVSVPSSAKIGDTVTITPQASNTAGSEFKYVWSYNNWKEWGVIKDYSFNTSAAFKFTKAGNYDIYIDSTDTRGNLKTKSKRVNVSHNVSYSSVSIPSSGKQGDTITIKPVVSNANGAKYKYVYSYDNWSKWGVIKDFSADSSMTYKAERTGKLDIYVDIMDSRGYVQTKSATANILPNLYFSSVNVVPTARVGQTVKISQIVSVASGTQFKYVWSYNGWKEWGVIQQMSPSSSASYKFTKRGTYDIYVDVRDSRGYIQSKSARVIVR